MQELTNNTLLHGGTYRIIKMLGQGSFGITYLAEHTSLGKKVAIKEFFMKELNSRGEDGSITGMSDGSLSYNYGQKFKKEAINLSRLEHPNIVRVTDSFDENGTYYYVMDFIEGQNLNDYIKSHSITEQEAVSIISGVAEALTYMHEQHRMLHLDLKPGNIMRRAGDGHIYLIDFGLSKHYSSDGQPETSTTIGLGTPGYAPIEQGNLAKNGEFRPAIDVYSLGATLYKLITGQTPPVASDIVSDEEILTTSMRNKGVSSKIIEIVEKAMMPNVKKRTQSIRAFIDSLPVIDDVKLSTVLTNNVETEETAGIGEVETREETIDSIHDNKPSSVTKNNDETEKTVYIAEVGEETVSVGEKNKKHPDFDEVTYAIEPKYKNDPASTVAKARAGDNDAAIAYGMMTLRGVGIAQNFNVAYRWFMFAKNNGDDRGEKMINRWSIVVNKYMKSQGDNEETSIGAGVGWMAAAIVILMVLIFGCHTCQENKEAEETAAEEARIDALVKNAPEWYVDGRNQQVYCVVEGQRHYFDLVNIPDGQRTIHYSSDDTFDTFVGTVKGGKRSQGKLTYKNGDYFEGTFINGDYSTGYGKITYGDGSTYEGNWNNGDWNGHGVYSEKDYRYEGNFKNHIYNGYGRQFWPTEKRSNWATEFEGSFVDGQRHGVGTWYFNNHTYTEHNFNKGKEGRLIEEGTWK